MATHKDKFFKTGKNDNILIKPFKLGEDNPVLNELRERYPLEDYTGEPVKEVEKVDKKTVYSSVFIIGECDASHPSYVTVPLHNKEHGNINGRVFKNSIKDIDKLMERYNNISIGDVIGKYNEFPKGSGKFAIMIDDIIDKTDTEDVINYVSVIEDDNILDIRDEFLFYVSKVEGNHKEFLLNMLDATWGLYSYAPASKGYHHNYIGGLLQHTVEVLRIAYTLGMYANKGGDNFMKYMMLLHRASSVLEWNLYKEIWEENEEVYSSRTRYFNKPLEGFSEMLIDMSNRINLSFYGKEVDERVDISLLMTGTILHDIGKVLEYSYPKDKELDKYRLFYGKTVEYKEGTINKMDDLGKRLGHIVIGELLCHKMYTSNDYDLTVEEYTDILSLISTHHFKGEWGSPTNAETTEELILHLADNIDAKISREY